MQRHHEPERLGLKKVEFHRNALNFSLLLALLVFAEAGRADPLDTWTLRNPSPTNVSLWGIAYGSGQFVAVGFPHAVLTSTNAVNWVPQPAVVAGYYLTGIAYGDGQFVVVASGQAGFVSSFVTSSNGVTPASGFNWDADFCGVAYGDGQFVVVGEDGNIFSSTNAVDWGGWQPWRLFHATTNTLCGITYGNGHFVAVGDLGTIVASADAVNWVRRQSGTTIGLNGIASGNGLFVAVGGEHPYPVTDYQLTKSVILTSTDGTDWVQREPVTTNVLHAIAYGSGQFIAVGEGGTLLSSTDGVNWVQRHPGTQNNLNGVTYGDGHFVVVGDNGTILESGSIITLALTPNVSTGLLTLSLTGPTGLAYSIEASADLVSWHSLTNIVSTQLTNVIFDALPVAGKRAFYRAYSQ